jgi:hypothetical protein
MTTGSHRGLRVTVVALVAICSIGWSGSTTTWVAWNSVGFFPPDLRRQVRLNEDRFDAGIRRGLSAPPAWRAAAPGNLEAALEGQIHHAAAALRTPVTMADLVEELGVLAVRVLDANDPLAAAHDDSLEPTYAGAYQAYVDSVRDRLRLVYYGQDPRIIGGKQVSASVAAILDRSRSLYPFLGAEFYRTGSLRTWRQLDDRSVAFGVAGVSLSRGLTDLANFAAYVWSSGGGLVPPPVPTPAGHVGATVTRTLGGGFPERNRAERGSPVMSESKLILPPP